MEAGFAERNITPEAGMEQPGGYGKAYHSGHVHDPCKVRVAVFGDGAERAALVGVDTLMVPRALVQVVRAAVSESCGLKPEAVLIGASHSHSAGPLGMVQPGEYDHASPLVQKLAYGMSSCADARYLESTRRQIIGAIEDACRNLRAARCGVGTGQEDTVSFNRRFRMKNGLSYTHPGKGNPDILEPAGPIDPEVGVIGAWSEEGGFLGCVVNFACHGTTGPGGASADWIYYLEQTIRGVMGQETVVVFLNGPCGDVTQVNNLSPYATEYGERSARLVGGRVGAETLKILAGMEAGDLAPVAARSRTLKFARRHPGTERLRRALRIVEQSTEDSGSTEWTFAKETVLLDALVAREPVAEVETQAVQVGPAVFLANPAEFFCQFGLDIKQGSPFPCTFPVELANGCVGYVPTSDAMSEHGGGYETRLSSYTNLDIQAGPQIVESLVGLSKELIPGASPEPPLAPPFNGPWSYGNVPPEV